MIEKVVKYTVAACLLAAVVLAGPVAGGLVYYGVPSPYALVVQEAEKEVVIDHAASRGDFLSFVQDTLEPPAAMDAPSAVPVTESQEVVIEWGNWVEVLLKPIRDFALALVPLIAAWVLALVPIWARMFIPAKRVNELMEQAVLSALVSVKGAAEGKKLTVTVTNNVLRQAAVYALAQAPALTKLVAGTLPQLLQKLAARLPIFAEIPADFTIEDAVKKITAESVKKQAEAQGIKDPFNRYFGT